MNQEESICRPYEKNINCFEKTIPDRFISSEKTKDYCSFKFPSGYSIYVEEFILKDAGPNNFVLLDDKHLEYSPKLKWTDRRNNFWSKLEVGHPLRKKSDLRSNFRCIQSLKVKNIEGFINRESLLMVYRQLGDFSLGRGPVGGSASWGRCQLGEVPVWASATWVNASWGTLTCRISWAQFLF